METHLTYDNAGKELGIGFKEKLTTASNLRLKVWGVLDTKRGAVDYEGRLQKLFVARALPREGPSAQKKKLKLALGLHHSSSQDDVIADLTAQKQFQLPLAEAWLKVVTRANHNTNTRINYGDGFVRVSKSLYNFTADQDLRIAGGYKGHVNHLGKFTGEWFGQLRENNWSLNTDFKGWWGVRYDL